ncbi:MAG: DUF4129 domain-containing protein [Candidatus Promineifilaceae bacterium]
MLARLPQKTITKLFLALGIIALVILAAGLSELNLDPGQTFAIQEDNVVTGNTTTITSFSPQWLIAAAVTLALIATLINFILTIRKGLRHTLPGIVSFVLFLLLLFFLREQMGTISPEAIPQEMTQTQSIDITQLAEEAVAVEPEIATPSDWLVLAIAVGIGLVVTVVGYVIYRRFFYKPAAATLQQLALDAEATLVKLQIEDANLRDVVMRCYFDMSKTVTEHGVRRTEGMTPREFEERLIVAGLPRRDVERLTRLFEEVRYGHIEVGERQKREAMACMEGIVAAAKRRTSATANQPSPANSLAR